MQAIEVFIMVIEWSGIALIRLDTRGQCAHRYATVATKLCCVFILQPLSLGCLFFCNFVLTHTNPVRETHHYMYWCMCLKLIGCSISVSFSYEAKASDWRDCCDAFREPITTEPCCHVMCKGVILKLPLWLKSLSVSFLSFTVCTSTEHNLNLWLIWWPPL